MANAPQAFIGLVEGEIADARVGQQLALLAGIDIDRDQIAIGVILVGVESGPAVGIEGDGGDLVEHHAIEVG